MSNLGVGGAAMQGISQGIQNVGAIYGIMRQKEADERERKLEPLRERALLATTKTAETQGAESELKLNQLREGERILNYDEITAPFRDKDPIGIDYTKNVARQAGLFNPDGTITQRNLAKARELSHQPEAIKERALLNIDAIDTKLKSMDRTNPTYTSLREQKAYLERLHGLAGKAQYVYDPVKKEGKWVDPSSGQDVPELKGMVPPDIQKMEADKGIEERKLTLEGRRVTAAETQATATQTAQREAQVAYAETQRYQRRDLEIKAGAKLTDDQLAWARAASPVREEKVIGADGKEVTIKTPDLVTGLETVRKLMPNMYKDLPATVKDPIDWSVRWANLNQQLKDLGSKLTPVGTAQYISQLKRDLPGISGELLSTQAFKNEFKDKPELRKFLEKNFPVIKPPPADASSDLSYSERLREAQRQKYAPVIEADRLAREARDKSELFERKKAEEERIRKVINRKRPPYQWERGVSGRGE